MAGSVTMGVEEAAAVAVAHPCTGLCPPEEVWDNFPLLCQLHPPNPHHHRHRRRHHRHLPPLPRNAFYLTMQVIYRFRPLSTAYND